MKESGNDGDMDNQAIGPGALNNLVDVRDRGGGVRKRKTECRSKPEHHVTCGPETSLKLGSFLRELNVGVRQVLDVMRCDHQRVLKGRLGGRHAKPMCAANER